MATSLLQLRTRARQRADQVGSTFVTDSELTNLINLGLAELYDQVVSAFEDYFTISTTLTVVSGSTAPLPADFYKLRALDYNNNGSYTALREFAFNDRNMNQISSSGFYRGYAVNRRYRIMGDNLLLQPEGQAAGYTAYGTHLPSQCWQQIPTTYPHHYLNLDGMSILYYTLPSKC